MIISETVLPREDQVVDDEEGEYDDEDDEDDVDEGQEGPETGGTHVEDEPIPPLPLLHPPPNLETDRSSSLTHMVFDPAFLQSFSSLQLEVAGIREGCIGMCNDIYCLPRRMESIEEGLTYFWGFVDRQEEQELRRIQREVERVIREAREYEEMC